MRQPVPAGTQSKPELAPLGAAFAAFSRFIAIGAIAAILNLLSRYLLNFVMPFEVAVVLAYICGMIVGFLLFQRLLSDRGASNFQHFPSQGLYLRRDLMRRLETPRRLALE